MPKINLDSVDESGARRQLLKDYLCGPSEANKIIEESRGLKQVQLEGSRTVLWMLEDDEQRLEKIDPEVPVLPKLLPKYDSYLMGHKNRSRIIRDELLQKVYRPVVGEVAATVLINGRIVATWTSKKTGRTLKIAVNPLEKLSTHILAELKPLADELALFVKAKGVQMMLSSP